MSLRSTTMLLAAACLAVAGPAEAARSADTAVAPEARSWEQIMSRSAVMGMQLAMQRKLAERKMPPAFVDCVDDIDPSALVPQFEQAIGKLLTPGEVDETERFWRSDAGAHVAELLLAQLARQLGSTPAHEVPPLDARERALVDASNASAATQKLMAESARTQGMFTPDVRSRLGELLTACRDKTR
jgi:hypothetical protein